MLNLIAIDMDGTLLTDKKTVDQRDVEAVDAARKRGIRIIPASGRTLAGIPREILELETEYAITSNGAVIVDCVKNQDIYRDDIDNAEAARAAAALRGFDGRLYASVYGGHWDVVKKNGPRIHNGPHDRAIEDLSEALVESKIRPEKIGFVAARKEDVDEILKLREAFPLLAMERTAPNAVEINARTVSKGRALLWLCERLGLERDGVMAIGDSDNDISMLDFAAYPVAMANSSEGLRGHAKYFTKDNNSCGVANAIDLALREWL